MERARPIEGHPTVEHFREIARELSVVLPISIYERANCALFNTVVIIDADGSVLGVGKSVHAKLLWHVFENIFLYMFPVPVVVGPDISKVAHS